MWEVGGLSENRSAAAWIAVSKSISTSTATHTCVRCKMIRISLQDDQNILGIYRHLQIQDSCTQTKSSQYSRPVSTRGQPTHRTTSSTPHKTSQHT